MTTVFILCGGRGTRLGHLCDDCPKPLLPVRGRPFVEHVVRFLHGLGLTRFVFLTGYLGNRFEEHFTGVELPGAQFRFVREETPLGTGGAVAAAVLKTEIRRPFLLLNADSFVPFDLQALTTPLRDHDGSLLTVSVADGARYGALRVTPGGLLLGFDEKRPEAGSAFINAGVYTLQPELFAAVSPDRPCSLERDLFPLWLRAGRRFSVVRSNSPFLDIGTPESLARADLFVAGVFGP